MKATRPTQIDYADVLEEAHAAAREAVASKGPENMMALNCGFAWVTISGTDPLARWCRAQRKRMANDTYATRSYFGDKHWHKGWNFWNPGNFSGQQVTHKEAGARAFRGALAKYGIVATVGSRLD
jgi:hypothetical protein